MSSALNNLDWNKEYPLSGNTAMTHLFYMDDQKLFAPNTAALHRCLDLVYEVSEAIGMQLGLKKCAMAHISATGPKGQTIDWEEPFSGITSLGGTETYRYLGTDQLMGIDRSATAKRVLTKTKAGAFAQGPQQQEPFPGAQLQGSRDFTKIYQDFIMK